MMSLFPQDQVTTLHNLNPRVKNVVLAQKEMDYDARGDSNQKLHVEQ